MGETEREMLEVCQKIRNMGGHNHLFAFFPERGSMMEDWPACDTSQWRRVQLARYMIDYGGGSVGQMRFDQHGQLTDYGLPAAEIGRLIQSGTPFPDFGMPGQSRGCSHATGLTAIPSLSHTFIPVCINGEDIALMKQQIAKKT
jgi:biotin synthase